MPPKTTNSDTLTVGQLAKRWGVSPERVRRLIGEGLLPGAFRIPSAGRYAETIKIPLPTIVQAESHWAVGTVKSAGPTRARRKRGKSGILKHLPELVNSEPDVECPEGDRC